ncbi:MAG: nitrite reductase large subunit NirB [Myxococcota bacterium]
MSRYAHESSHDCELVVKLVLVGNGMAGVRTLEELLRLDASYEITVFGDEPHPNYNRIMLSPVLAGEKRLDEIILNDRAWYEQNGITLHTGERVIEIDREGRRVVGDQGTVVTYDRLILATGSRPFILPVPGRDLPGVLAFRDIRDVETMVDASSRYRRAVVIGGGLLGLEAASGLKARGMDVTVVHLLDTLMERQLDAFAGTLLKASLEERGIDFRMCAKTSRLVGEERVQAVEFEDGTRLDADLVVMAVGIRPNMELAAGAGLECRRGVVVSDTMVTSDPTIYAVGECVEHRGTTYGLVAPLYEQGRVVAQQLAGARTAAYEGSLVSTRLKVTGIDVFSAGDFGGEGEEVSFQDPHRGVYKKLVVRDGKIAGAVLYGDAADGPWLFQLMKDQTDVSEIRDTLIFGRAYAEGAPAGESAMASAPDDFQVCNCNGVCKGDIVRTIRKHRLTTLSDVKSYTKAGSSCGSCSGDVEAILAATLGDDFVEKAPSICPCTDSSHDEVRAFVNEGSFDTVQEVLDAMAWKNPDGCAKCRPAVNYYLLCARPLEYRDDGQSRFINERVHANIQKDGTYSVVPRIFGGVTTPKQLRAIADVAESFNVPSVKITGGQRIDLLGVKKEDLPAIWAELGRHGFVSGHAYAKGVRTVKTCVGSEWCRFGTQDSTGMGIQIEELTWGSWTPHKFKLAVSGCPRNCAEATIKDFGVVAIEGGWELYVGGNGGIKVRAADLLTRVTTEAEVLEYCGAFLQLYREEGRYLERTAPFVERVGLAYLKERVVGDASGRRALFQRFAESQKKAQVDPWAERAKGVDAHEFQPLSELAVLP